MNLRVLCILFGVLSIASCAHHSVEQDTPSQTEVAALFGKAENAFRARDYGRASLGYKKIRNQHPGTRQARLSQYRLGSIAYQRKNYEQAAQYFSEMLKPAADGSLIGIDEFKLDAVYNLAACEFQLKRFERAYESLGLINLALVPPGDTKKTEMIYALIERTARKLKDTPGLIAVLSAYVQLPLPAETSRKLREELAGLIGATSEHGSLEKLLSGGAGGRLRPISLVQDEMTRDQIRNQIRKLSGEAPDKGIFGAVDSTPLSLESTRVIRVGSGTVGVLLPLTGKFSAVGKRALDSIALSSALFDPSSGSKLKLFFADTKSNEVAAELALVQLVEEHNISVVIGPLTSKEAFAVAKRAQELEVINLSLAPREGITDVGPFVFQNALTPKVQVESLVEFCIQEKGYRRFGILASHDPFGTDMAYRFWDAVEKNGAAVVSFESYAPEDTDFQVPIQKLVGLHQSEKYRKTELTKIADFQKELKKKNPKQRERRIRLQPIVDFDALFMPDGAKVVSQIVPNLAYFDVRDLPLLGTAEWGTGQLFRRVGKPVIGSFFPVALHPDTRRPAQFAFISQYREALGALPDLLSSQAFEAVAVVVAALAKADSGSARDIASTLSEMQNFESPLGDLSFDEKRVAIRRLPIFTIDPAGSLVEVSKSRG